MYGHAAECTFHVAAATGANSTTERPSAAAVAPSPSRAPRRSTFQPAGSTAAASASPNASSGTREHALGGGEKRPAERSPELVPAGDLPLGLGAEPCRVGRPVGRVLDPTSELRRGHLGVALHAPARVAQPERLRARSPPR